MLRVLADFALSYEFRHNRVNDAVADTVADSLFTAKDVKARGSLFVDHLEEILATSPKYQHLLAIIQNRDEAGFQPHGKLIVGSAFPIVAFLIKEVRALFSHNLCLCRRLRP